MTLLSADHGLFYGNVHFIFVFSQAGVIFETIIGYALYLYEMRMIPQHIYIQVLLELIQTKVNYVVQESVIVIKDIFRRYPNRYESIIATLCDNLDSLDEPMAKASMIWIIGEYAERIDNADELLDTFLESFDEEDPAVQLQLLTATVKCFLKVRWISLLLCFVAC